MALFYILKKVYVNMYQNLIKSLYYFISQIKIKFLLKSMYIAHVIDWRY